MKEKVIFFMVSFLQVGQVVFRFCIFDVNFE